MHPRESTSLVAVEDLPDQNSYTLLGTTAESNSLVAVENLPDQSSPTLVGITVFQSDMLLKGSLN